MRQFLLLSFLAMRSLATESTDDRLFIAGAGDGLPEQFWISQGPTPTSMKISWLTAGKADSTVQYGPGLTASGSASQYDTLGYTSGFIHIVQLDDLTPGAVYAYRVGGESSGWSANMTFTACRGVGAVYPFTLAAIGDLGQTNNSNSTIWHVKASRADAVFITGDLSYADGDQPRWDSFQRLISPLSSSISVQVRCGGRDAVRWKSTSSLTVFLSSSLPSSSLSSLSLFSLFQCR